MKFLGLAFLADTGDTEVQRVQRVQRVRRSPNGQMVIALGPFRAGLGISVISFMFEMPKKMMVGEPRPT